MQLVARRTAAQCVGTRLTYFLALHLVFIVGHTLGFKKPRSFKKPNLVKFWGFQLVFVFWGLRDDFFVKRPNLIGFRVVLVF